SPLRPPGTILRTDLAKVSQTQRQREREDLYKQKQLAKRSTAERGAEVRPVTLSEAVMNCEPFFQMYIGDPDPLMCLYDKTPVPCVPVSGAKYSTLLLVSEASLHDVLGWLSQRGQTTLARAVRTKGDLRKALLKLSGHHRLNRGDHGHRLLIVTENSLSLKNVALLRSICLTPTPPAPVSGQGPRVCIGRVLHYGSSAMACPYTRALWESVLNSGVSVTLLHLNRPRPISFRWSDILSSMDPERVLSVLAGRESVTQSEGERLSPDPLFRQALRQLAIPPWSSALQREGTTPPASITATSKATKSSATAGPESLSSLPSGVRQVADADALVTLAAENEAALRSLSLQSGCVGASQRVFLEDVCTSEDLSLSPSLSTSTSNSESGSLASCVQAASVSVPTVLPGYSPYYLSPRPSGSLVWSLPHEADPTLADSPPESESEGEGEGEGSETDGMLTIQTRKREREREVSSPAENKAPLPPARKRKPPQPSKPSSILPQEREKERERVSSKIVEVDFEESESERERLQLLDTDSYRGLRRFLLESSLPMLPVPQDEYTLPQDVYTEGERQRDGECGVPLGDSATSSQGSLYLSPSQLDPYETLSLCNPLDSESDFLNSPIGPPSRPSRPSSIPSYRSDALSLAVRSSLRVGDGYGGISEYGLGYEDTDGLGSSLGYEVDAFYSDERERERERDRYWSVLAEREMERERDSESEGEGVTSCSPYASHPTLSSLFHDASVPVIHAPLTDSITYGFPAAPELPLPIVAIDSRKPPTLTLNIVPEVPARGRSARSRARSVAHEATASSAGLEDSRERKKQERKEEERRKREERRKEQERDREQLDPAFQARQLNAPIPPCEVFTDLEVRKLAEGQAIIQSSGVCAGFSSNFLLGCVNPIARRLGTLYTSPPLLSLTL
ncbi:hypothetical protein KIPB_008161, partial [Kipferlia bialata]